MIAETKICSWCRENIVNSPYVVKEWEGIDEHEVYHTRCFVVAHQALLTKEDKTEYENFVRNALKERAR